MKWLEHKPTAPGLYWWRHNDGFASVVTLYYDWRRELRVVQPEEDVPLEDLSGLWAGPIAGPITELQRDLAERNEDIGRLQGQLKQAMARNAELEAAQQWQPLTDYCLVADKVDSNIHFGIMRGGQRFMVSLPSANEEIILDLPSGYAICHNAAGEIRLIGQSVNNDRHWLNLETGVIIGPVPEDREDEARQWGYYPLWQIKEQLSKVQPAA